jgi:hypothetical protein
MKANPRCDDERGQAGYPVNVLSATLSAWATIVV